MPQYFVFESVLKLNAAERDAARTANRVLREAEIRPSDRESRLITFTSCLGSNPVNDTDKCPSTFEA